MRVQCSDATSIASSPGTRRRAAPVADVSLRIVIDCGMGTAQNLREVHSLAKQLSLCICANRRCGRPAALHLASWSGPIVEAAAYIGGAAWPAVRHDQDAMHVFQPGEVVILSPDAEEPLTEVDPTKVYCIGGIIDRSVVKNITLDIAARHDVPARRLPIAEHARLLGFGPSACLSPVLNVSDALVALLEFHHTGDWVHALQAAIPSRKTTQPPPRPRKLRLSKYTDAGSTRVDEVEQTQLLEPSVQPLMLGPTAQ